MDEAETIAEQAAEIAETAAAIAEEAAVEAGETPPAPAVSDGVAEAIHDVSLQEQLAECQAAIARMEERLSNLSFQAVEAETKAEIALSQADAATSIALDSLQGQSEPELSSAVEEIPAEPSPQQEPPKRNLWEDLWALP